MSLEPIGARLRRERVNKASAAVPLEKKLLSIDERIKLLECNVISDSSSSNSEDDRSDSDTDLNEVQLDSSIVVAKDASGRISSLKSSISGTFSVHLSLFTASADIIPPLPKQMLPAPKCKATPGSK